MKEINHTCNVHLQIENTTIYSVENNVLRTTGKQIQNLTFMGQCILIYFYSKTN